MSPAKHPSAWARLCEAAIAYADASDDDAQFMRARDRLRKAAVAYTLDTSRAPEVRRRVIRRAAYCAPQLALWPRPVAQ